MAQTDRWAAWLAELRTGGEADERRRGFERLNAWRDRILDNANLAPGETLLDVGCGEGLVGFGALGRNAGRVVFSDISRDLLDFCRSAAADFGVLERTEFVRATAEELSSIPDASVDVVTTRSVLIYVQDKAAALREFYRVVRPGGRISLFEPVNRFAQTDGPTWSGYDVSEVAEIAGKVRAAYEGAQPPDSDPMFDFDERDLLRLAEHAGFFPIRLDLECSVEEPGPRVWDTFASVPPNPRAPSLAEAMERALTPEERDRLVAHLRPLVEDGEGVSRMALAFLVGVRPGASEATARLS